MPYGYFNNQPRLDSSNILHMWSNKTDIARLLRFQNWAAKYIFVANKKDHSIPFLKQLHRLPVKQSFLFKVLLHVFKCFADSAPAY